MGKEVFVITTWNSSLDHPDSVVIRDERQAWNFYEQEVNAMADMYASLFIFQPKNETHQDEKKTTRVWFDFSMPDAFVSIQKTTI